MRLKNKGPWPVSVPFPGGEEIIILPPGEEVEVGVTLPEGYPLPEGVEVLSLLRVGEEPIPEVVGEPPTETPTIEEPIPEVETPTLQEGETSGESSTMEEGTKSSSRRRSR